MVPELGIQSYLGRVIFQEELFGDFWQLHVNLKDYISFANLGFYSPESTTENKKGTGSDNHYSSECFYFIVQLLSFQFGFP